MWNIQMNPFEPFIKDIVGKCEICFRSGFCSIAECKEQEKKENEVINSIVNSAHLTSKNSPGQNPQGSPVEDNQIVKNIETFNKKAEKLIGKSLTHDLHIGNLDMMKPVIQNLMENYANKQNVALSSSFSSIFSKSITLKTIPNVWDTTNAEKIKENSEKAINKIENTIQNLKSLIPQNKQLSKEQKKTISTIKKSTKNTIDKNLKEITKKGNKLQNQQTKLEKLNQSPLANNPSSKANIAKTLNQVKQAKEIINQSKKGLENEKKELKSIKI
jgi:hypothetical protein